MVCRSEFKSDPHQQRHGPATASRCGSKARGTCARGVFDEARRSMVGGASDVMGDGEREEKVENEKKAEGE